MSVKHGRNAKLEAEAKELLAKSVRKQKRSPARDAEKMAYEHGFITADELQHYDPNDTWTTVDSAFQIITGAADIDYLDGTADEENIIHRHDQLVKRRELMRAVDDDSDPLIEGDEDHVPPLGAYDVRPKICTRCNRPKRRDQFSPDKRKNDGLQSQCKKCHAEITAQNRKNSRSQP